MKKKIMLLIGILFIFSLSGQFALGEDSCSLVINNHTYRYWMISINNIFVGIADPFKNQEIKMQCPTKKFQAELNGMSDDTGHMQRRFFWPEDEADNKFVWMVEP